MKGGTGFIIIECRRYTTSKQSQEKMAALAYRMMGTGTGGVIIVTPFGIQEGANKIVKASNIRNVIFDADSTQTSYVLKFLNDLMIDIEDKIEFSDYVSAEIVQKFEDTVTMSDCFTITITHTCPHCGCTFEQKSGMVKCQNCSSVNNF